MTNLGIQILTKAKKKQLKTYLKLYHEEKLNTDQVHTLCELRRVVAVISTIPPSLSYTAGFHSASTALFENKCKVNSKVIPFLPILVVRIKMKGYQ